MSDKIPTTETMTISDVRAGLNQLVNRVYRHETRVIVEKSGIPVAAVVSVDDVRRLQQLDEDLAKRRRVLEAMREPFRDVPPEEIERETQRIISEMRDEERGDRQQAAN